MTEPTTWNRRLIPLFMGFVIGSLGFFLAATGWGVLILYAWVFILIGAVLIFARTLLTRRTSKISAFSAMVTVGALALTMTAAGCGTLIINKHKLCRMAEGLISQMEQLRAKNGAYPSDALALMNTNNLRIRMNKVIPGGELDLDGVNDSDVIFYCDKSSLLCLVPVTKMLPMSITRLYVLEWSTESPSWSYQKMIWDLFAA